MTFSVHIYLVLASILLHSYPIRSASPPNSALETFVSKLLSSFFPKHRIFLVFGDFSEFKNDSYFDFTWKDKFEKIINVPDIRLNSGGVLNVLLKSNQTEFATIERPKRSLSVVTQIVILILPNGIPSRSEETVLLKRLNLPLLSPPTVRNADKFVLLTKGLAVEPISQYTFFRKLKYRISITENGKVDLILYHFCLHCPSPHESFLQSKLNFMQVSDYFPDFQRNYFGYVLKATATDKMYGDLEFGKDPKTGKDYAKRGIFAIVLRHLSQALNFTGETFRASGGGSTGTPLPNGSWVGSVGDVYYGDATFCMLCSISLSRHTVINQLQKCFSFKNNP